MLTRPKCKLDLPGLYLWLAVYTGRGTGTMTRGAEFPEVLFIVKNLELTLKNFGQEILLSRSLTLILIFSPQHVSTEKIFCIPCSSHFHCFPRHLKKQFQVNHNISLANQKYYFNSEQREGWSSDTSTLSPSRSQLLACRVPLGGHRDCVQWFDTLDILQWETRPHQICQHNDQARNE